MMTFRLVTALAAGLLAAPATAEEFIAYHQLEVESPASPGCRAAMLLNQPRSWRSDDGAVVLLTLGERGDTARDVLVAALLDEDAAVLELRPFACGGDAGGRDSVVASARGALDAMTRVAGAGMVVAIGYGPGAAALLDVARDPADAPAGPRYAAAVAMGDGQPAFAVGSARPPQEHAPARLASLCRALAAIAGGMGLSPERERAAAAAATCVATMADATPSASPIQAAAARR